MRAIPSGALAFAVFLVAGATVGAGCGGPAGPVLQDLVGHPGQRTPDPLEPEDATDPVGPVPGSWTGTITLHGVVSEDETKDIRLAR